MTFEGLLPQAEQVVEFDIMSIIFLVVILIFVIIHAFKGFLGSIVSLLTSFGSLFFASFLSEPVGNFLYGTGLSRSVYNPIFDWVSTQGDGLLNQTITVENQDAILGDAFNLLNIPEILHGILKELVMSFVPEGGGNLAEILSESLTLYAFIAISYVLLGIVIFIIFKILEGIAKKANEQPGIGVINRIFGGVVGAVIGLAICFLVCYGISTLSAFNIEFANDLIVNMKIPDDSVWTFAKALFNNNLIAYIISLFI